MHDRALCAASNCMCAGTGCPSRDPSCSALQGSALQPQHACATCARLQRGTAGWSPGLRGFRDPNLIL